MNVFIISLVYNYAAVKFFDKHIRIKD